MSLSIVPTVLLEGHPFFPQHVSDRSISTLSFCRVRSYSLIWSSSFVRSFRFVLTLHILSTITFSTSTHLNGSTPYISCKQHLVRRTATTYMVLWQCCQWQYFWWEQATTMSSFGDLRSQRQGQRGMLDPYFFLVTKDMVLDGRCQPPFFCIVMSNYRMNC